MSTYDPKAFWAAYHLAKSGLAVVEQVPEERRREAVRELGQVVSELDGLLRRVFDGTPSVAGGAEAVQGLVAAYATLHAPAADGSPNDLASDRQHLEVLVAELGAGTPRPADGLAVALLLRAAFRWLRTRPFQIDCATPFLMMEPDELASWQKKREAAERVHEDAALGLVEALHAYRSRDGVASSLSLACRDLVVFLGKAERRSLRFSVATAAKVVWLEPAQLEHLLETRLSPWVTRNEDGTWSVQGILRGGQAAREALTAAAPPEAETTEWRENLDALVAGGLRAGVPVVAQLRDLLLRVTP